MQLELMDSTLTPEGWLRCKAIVTGVSVIDYTDIFGFHAFRSEEEVFKPESMETLKGVPLTQGHPPRLLSAEDVDIYQIGYTGDEVWREGVSLGINLTITKKWVVDVVMEMLTNGIAVRFSVGQRALPVAKPGIYQGLSYDVELQNIIYNHLAILLDPEDGKARYNKTFIITDSKTADQAIFIMDSAYLLTKTKEVETVKITLPSGVQIEVADAEARHVENLITEHKDLQTKYANQRADLKTAQKSLESAQAQVMDSSKINELFSQRLELAEEAKPLMDSEVTIKELAAMDSAQVYEKALLANGYTQDELDAEKKELNDSYPAFLKGTYKSLVKSKGVEVSDSIIENAGRTSTAGRERQSGEIVVNDAYAEAKAKRLAAQEARNKGVKVDAN